MEADACTGCFTNDGNELVAPKKQLLLLEVDRLNSNHSIAVRVLGQPLVSLAVAKPLAVLIPNDSPRTTWKYTSSSPGRANHTYTSGHKSTLLTRSSPCFITQFYCLHVCVGQYYPKVHGGLTVNVV